MKNKLRKIILVLSMLIFTLFLAGLGTAATVNLDPQGILANQSYQSSSTVTPNFNVTGNSTIWLCKLYTNENSSSGVGSWREVQTDSGATNGSYAINFSQRQAIKDISGLTYAWDVFCNSTNDVAGGWGGFSNSTMINNSFNYSVDTTSPIISSAYPENLLRGFSTSEWIDNANGNNSVRVGGTVWDNNSASCLLYMDYMINGTNSSLVNTSLDKYDYTSGTSFNFSRLNGSTGFQEDSVGYNWSMLCNDSAGNNAASSGTFKVDTILPAASAATFDFNLSDFKTNSARLLWNATTATDFTPQIGWYPITETNFNRYRVSFNVNQHSNSTGAVQHDVTIVSNLTANMSLLLDDLTYKINITAYDDANNTLDIATSYYTYLTTSINRELDAGWNIISNVGPTFNLSQLLEWSGATTVSIWNSSHEFQSHVSGGSNGVLGINASGTFEALVYLSAAANFSDLITNTSVITNLSVSLTNQSESDWNLVMNRNWSTDFSLQRIDNYLNSAGGFANGNNTQSNITFFSFYNNTASTGSKYIPVVANWSINNATELKFGKACWMFMGAESISYQTLDWNAIT